MFGGVQMKTADKLKKFREDCERETGQPAQRIELPLSHVLADICRLLGYPPKTKRKVLGKKTYQRLEHLVDLQVELKDKPKH
jgi:hypothetical protein